MNLTEAIELIEDVRQAIEMDDSGQAAFVVAHCHGLVNSPLFKSLSMESHWLNSMVVLTAIAGFNFASVDIFTSLGGARDLLVIEHIIKDWNKEFSFKLGGNDTDRQGYRLEAEILIHVIDSLDLLIRREKISIQDARDMFLGIFWEEGLTPCRCYNTEAKPKKREVVRLFQSQNRKLMKVADDFENPFDKNLMPYTYRFTEICDIRSGESDLFRKTRWYPLVKARKAWTTWYLSNGIIATQGNQTNEISFENRGRSKNKIVKSSQPVKGFKTFVQVARFNAS